jgi:hypothetical protein
MKSGGNGDHESVHSPGLNQRLNISEGCNIRSERSTTREIDIHNPGESNALCVSEGRQVSIFCDSPASNESHSSWDVLIWITLATDWRYVFAHHLRVILFD